MMQNNACPGYKFTHIYDLFLLKFPLWIFKFSSKTYHTVSCEKTSEKKSRQKSFGTFRTRCNIWGHGVSETSCCVCEVQRYVAHVSDGEIQSQKEEQKGWIKITMLVQLRTQMRIEPQPQPVVLLCLLSTSSQSADVILSTLLLRCSKRSVHSENGRRGWKSPSRMRCASPMSFSVY